MANLAATCAHGVSFLLVVICFGTVQASLHVKGFQPDKSPSRSLQQADARADGESLRVKRHPTSYLVEQYPRILHQMHKSLDALSDTQRLLHNKCKQLHPHWQVMFWDDEKLHEFVRSSFPWFYDTWMSIEPLIKKLDSSRYMLMYAYGGVYIDVDVECITPLDSMIDPLPRGAAWTGDFPEPMFVMSAPRNIFWLHALHRIKKVWRTLDAWHSTGPAGLNAAMVRYVEKHGSGVLVPYITHRPEAEFHTYIKKKNNTVPWFELANGNWNLKDPSVNIWYQAGTSPNSGKQAFPLSQGNIPPHMQIGFLANELLDPVSCSAYELRDCVDSFCAAKFPLNYLVHHCMNTWRGRIGTT